MAAAAALVVVMWPERGKLDESHNNVQKKALAGIYKQVMEIIIIINIPILQHESADFDVELS